MLASCDHIDEITPRKYVELVVGHAGRLKIDIARSLSANPQTPVPQAGPLNLAPPPGLDAMTFDFGWVMKNGALIVHSKNYGVTLVQEPIVTKDGVSWTCVVHPAEAKPALCGSDYQNAELQRMSSTPVLPSGGGRPGE